MSSISDLDGMPSTSHGPADCEEEGSSIRAFDPSAQRWVEIASPPVLDDTLSFRAWRASDASRYQALLGDADVWRHLPETFPGNMTLEDALALINLSNEAPNHLVRAICWRDEPIGQVRLDFLRHPDRRLAELSYWFGRAFWGKGHGRNAVPAFVRDMLKDISELRQIEARVHPDNPASARILETTGFKLQEKREDANGWLVYARGRCQSA